MLQNKRNENERQNSSGHSGENRERNGGDGFEGMNYEQRRPSYNPQQVNNSNTNDNNEYNGERNEL